MTHRVTLLTDDERGVCPILAEELARRGHEVARVRLGEETREIEPGRYTGNLVSPEAASELLDVVRRRQGPIGGIVHLLPLRSDARFDEMDFGAWRQRLKVETKSLFFLLKGLSADVEGAAQGGPDFVVAATAMGGTFGNDRGAEMNGFFPGQGAIYGLLKTLAQEWPEVHVKVVDLNLQESLEALAAHLLVEVTEGDGELEVGYNGSRRFTLQPRLSPVAQDAPTAVTMDDSWVILVTGGARGITAEVAMELAQHYRPTLLLVGRSPQPQSEESPETAGLSSPQELKSALMDQMRLTGEPVTPAEVEKRYARLSRDREIRTNIAAMRQAGARVHYYQAEVRDEGAFGGLIDEVYRKFGRLDGVIHGAGVIEDKLIKDKAPDSFDRVFDTKVDSAFVLSRKLRSASLKFLVFFASVAGRFGNRGQADYAAANEVLNKLAVSLDRVWPGRVVSLNWGPWSTTGMVSPEVRKQFALRGVRLIPPGVGRRRLTEELRYGRKGEVEVIIGGGSFDAPLWPNSAPAPSCPLIGHVPPTARASDGSMEVVRTLETGHDLYLLDHQLDGQPVLPMAAALELMAELAAQGWPELQVVGVRGLRLLQGVVLQGSSAPIRVVARPQQRSSQDRLSVDAEILGVENPKAVHYRATIEMARYLPPPPSVSLPPLTEARPYPIPVDEAYRRFGFHGPLFQKATVIGPTGHNGIEGALEPSSPQEWIAGAPGGRWLIDPAVFDCGLQFVVLWVRDYWDMMALPARFSIYHRFGPPPLARIRCEVRLRPEQRKRIVHGDLFFHGPEGRLFGILEGMEFACSKKLDRVVGNWDAVRSTP
jgi:NAD(P)-dependent dehydrogenase (short-subunit alcohol dehydrogenase family)